ncbi:hypothetical protein AVEN_187563-1 [Araneus ventricosus]|uniref:Uncharacterized protein n=1 Tax=Araneus ventricosus TaxID=182803 RepID=A0A4Y2RCZ0_ARAVE|nr:hypothetical protein AVEN_187563-1 [Araneus ventricosus]
MKIDDEPTLSTASHDCRRSTYLQGLFNGLTQATCSEAMYLDCKTVIPALPQQECPVVLEITMSQNALLSYGLGSNFHQIPCDSLSVHWKVQVALSININTPKFFVPCDPSVYLLDISFAHLAVTNGCSHTKVMS